MEAVIVGILFCILAVLSILTWIMIDKMIDLDKGIRSLFPWLEMIKRETEYTNPLINKLIEWTKSIFDLLEKKRKDEETERDIKRKISNDYDEAVRERIETLKNMDTKDNNPHSPKFQYNLNQMIKNRIKKVNDKDENYIQSFKEGMQYNINKFKLEKKLLDYLQEDHPNTRDNFSFKSMKSLGDAGEFMKVIVPPTGEGFPISIELLIQNGPIKEYGEHGMQVTDVLRWVRNMYSALNAKFPCEENVDTMHYIELALDCQRKRTERRETQGIEGYNKEIVNEPTQTEVDEIMECLSSFGEAREFTAENNYEGLKEYLNGTTEPTQTINEDLNESE